MYLVLELFGNKLTIISTTLWNDLWNHPLFPLYFI